MSVASATHAPVPTRARHRRRGLSPTVLVVALVLAPVVATVLSVIGRHWHAGADQALELLRIHDVGTRHTPLVGAWSRWGWAHPGPVLYFLLAPFYGLFGDTGVLVGMGILNGAAIAGGIVVAHRRGGTELAALVGLMMAVLVQAAGIDQLIDPWNPWAAFLPFVLFLLLTWAVLCRDWVLLLPLVAVGSLVAQVHTGYVPFVVVLGLVAAGYAMLTVARTRRANGEHRSVAGRWLAIGALVAMVLWLPPLLQQFSGDHGNLTALVSYARHPAESIAGWESAVGTLGEELRPIGPWVTGNDDNGSGITATAAVWPALVMLALLAGASVLAWRRGERDAARLTLVAMLATVVAVLATSRLTGVVFYYLTRWWWAVAALAVVALVWVLVKVFDSAPLRKLVTGGAVVGIALLGIISAADLPASVPLANGSAAIAQLSPTVAGALDRRSRYLVRGLDIGQFGVVSTGLFVDLDSRGFNVYSEPGESADLQYGSWRLARPQDVDAIISVVDATEVTGPPDPRSELIASYDPLTPEQRARARELEASIRAEMGTRAPTGRVVVDRTRSRAAAVDNGASPGDVQELGMLQQKGAGYAVYVTPAR